MLPPLKYMRVFLGHWSRKEEEEAQTKVEFSFRVQVFQILSNLLGKHVRTANAEREAAVVHKSAKVIKSHSLPSLSFSISLFVSVSLAICLEKVTFVFA